MKWTNELFPSFRINSIDVQFHDGVYQSLEPHIIAAMAAYEGRYGVVRVDGTMPEPGPDQWPGAVNDDELDEKVAALVPPATGSATAEALRAALDARIAADGTVIAAAAIAVDDAVLAGNVVPRFPDVGLVPSQVLVKDSFNRADSTTSMGAAETGQTWTFTGTDGGTVGIIGNAAYLRTVGLGLRHSLIDCGKRDVRVTMDATLGDAATRVGIALRQLDPTNSLAVFFGTTDLLIYSINDATHSTRATVPIPISVGTPHQFEARISGDAEAAFIHAYVDGVLVHIHSLSSADRAKFANATQHGIKWGVPANAGATRVDSIQISTLLLPTDRTLREWAASESYELVTATAADTDGFIPSAVIRWPDGAPGVYTLVTKKITTAYKAVDAYTATHVSSGRKVTQAAPTRAAAGHITAKPVLTVGAI